MHAPRGDPRAREGAVLWGVVGCGAERAACLRVHVTGGGLKREKSLS